MNRKRHHDQRHAERRYGRMLALALGIAIVVATVWGLSRDDSAELLRQARDEYVHGAPQSESLARRAIELAGGAYPDAQLLVACVLARRGDWDLAQRELGELDLTRCSPDLLSELGTLASTSNRMVLAQRALEALTKVSSEDVEPWLQLAAVHDALGRPQSVTNAYRMALRSPLGIDGKQHIRHRLIEHLILLGDASAARQELEQVRSATQVGPSDLVRIAVHEARLLRLEGQSEAALPAIDRALKSLGDAPGALRLRGLLLMDVGRFSEAIADLVRVAELDPHDEITHYKLAEAYRRQQNPEQAAYHLGEYERIHQARLEISELQRAIHEQTQTPEQLARLRELQRQFGRQP